MHHFVAKASWDERAVVREARNYALQALGRRRPIQAWVVDDTGIPKKGQHSVGVARQYCGILGKQDNCQVAVSVSLAHPTLSIPAAYRLYLPKEWAEDEERRNEAGVPATVRFAPKWRIALDLIDELIEEGVETKPVIADAGYGDTTAFRQELEARGLHYGVGVKGQTKVWPPGTVPLAAKPWSGRGRPTKRLRRDREHSPVSIEALAKSLAPQAYRTVRWREGTRGSMQSRFARVRVRPAHKDYDRSEPYIEQWLLIEWPDGQEHPTKFWLSNLPKSASTDDLVSLVMIRWRIERDYQELKSELGLDHYEGRGWRGFHHHAALCIAAHCFLVAERGQLFPPAAQTLFDVDPLPKGFTPRGATDSRRPTR
jgi:SRSO17 transposase